MHAPFVQSSNPHQHFSPVNLRLFALYLQRTKEETAGPRHLHLGCDTRERKGDSHLSQSGLEETTKGRKRTAAVATLPSGKHVGVER